MSYPVHPFEYEGEWSVDITSFPLLIERFLRAATAAVTVSISLLDNKGTNASSPPLSAIFPWLASKVGRKDEEEDVHVHV